MHECTWSFHDKLETGNHWSWSTLIYNKNPWESRPAAIPRPKKVDWPRKWEATHHNLVQSWKLLNHRLRWAALAMHPTTADPHRSAPLPAAHPSTWGMVPGDPSGDPPVWWEFGGPMLSRDSHLESWAMVNSWAMMINQCRSAHDQNPSCPLIHINPCIHTAIASSLVCVESPRMLTLTRRHSSPTQIAQLMLTRWVNPALGFVATKRVTFLFTLKNHEIAEAMYKDVCPLTLLNNSIQSWFDKFDKNYRNVETHSWFRWNHWRCTSSLVVCDSVVPCRVLIARVAPLSCHGL